MIFEGSAVAIITPFDDRGEVDYESYEKLINFHLENKTDAIVALGTTAEATCLTDDEKFKLIDISIEKIKGKIPLIVGTGSNNTRTSAEFSKKVSAIDGVDGLLVVSPYYNKANEEGLYEHFKTIAQSSSKPIILYDVPSRTNVKISIENLIKLSKIENIVGIKDARGDLNFTTAIRKNLGDDFAIYSGNDDLISPLLSLGGNGVISVLANICPRGVHDLVKAGLDGDFKKASSLQIKYYDLIEAIFNEVNPIGVKYALAKMGLCKNNLRLPLTRASVESENLINKAMEDIND